MISVKVGIINTLLNMVKYWENKDKGLVIVESVYWAIGSIGSTRKIFFFSSPYFLYVCSMIGTNHITLGRSGVLELSLEKYKQYKNDKDFCHAFFMLFSNISVESCK